ncbi:hypothetical protein CSC33_0924 [Pseudomonas aeruginosa]|nr:hypothetical protein CSC33_0924 [Pseudomonas aeruginosa]
MPVGIRLAGAGFRTGAGHPSSPNGRGAGLLRAPPRRVTPDQVFGAPRSERLRQFLAGNLT